MRLFKFQGDWETTIQLNAFKGFQSLNRNYNDVSTPDTDGILHLEIEKDFNGKTAPHPEQIAAINYLLAHQKAIVQIIIHHIRNDYDNLVSYGYAGEGDSILPHPFENDDHVRRMVGFSTITVLLEHKDGVSYLGYSGICDWDPEHGLGATLHKKKIIEYSDNGSGVSWYAAAKDSGNYDFWQQKRENRVWE